MQECGVVYKFFFVFVFFGFFSSKFLMTSSLSL